MKFNVTYQIVTEESAEQGEAAESGFISEGVDLRAALVDVWATRTALVGGVSGVSADTRSITIDNGAEFLTGCYESRTLHPDFAITPSSMRRLVRIVEGG